MAKDAPRKELHTVWNLPGINKTEFYAACIYLNAAQKQQAKTALMPGPQREPETSKATRDFLDNLADCLARSKADDRPQHVTATAMVISYRSKKIVIAKNRAEDYSNPQSQGQKDKDFAEVLQKWFTRLSTEDPNTTGPNPSEDNRHWDVWEKMLEFNDSRVIDCIKKAKKTKKNKSAIEEASKRLPGAFEEHKSGFEKAWAVFDLCNKVTDLKSLKSKSQCIEKAGDCREDRSFSRVRHIVREERKQDARKKNDYKELSELIKSIDLLGRLRYAFEKFQEYCRRSKREDAGYHFTLVFLDSSLYSKYYWPEDCPSKIEEWYELNPGHRDALPQELRENAMKKAKLNREERPPLFHCELQLLKYFIDNPASPSEERQDYFGCSKRSCWLCWSILTYVNKFHTKDSHEKIYDSWAFPVLFSPEKEKLLLSTALTKTYRDLVRVIRDKIFAGRGFAEHEVRSETSGRAPEMAPIVNTPRPGIRRIALPESDRPMVKEVRCVCFPAYGSTLCEEVMVELYEMKDDDLFEWMQPALLCPGLEYKKYLYAAFTLVNKPSNENSFADQSWASEIFPCAYDGDHRIGDLVLYFQSNPDAKSNPWIKDQLTEKNLVRDVDWEVVTAQEDFLWRGNIFAVLTDEEKKIVLQDDLAFVTEVLTRKFQRMTLKEYEEISDRLAESRREIERRKRSV